EAAPPAPHAPLPPAQLLIVLLDLLRRPPQVGNVAEHGHDARAFARIFHRGAQHLEQQIRAVAPLDQQQFPRFAPRELATISRPSVSVSMIGSVTELMIVKNSARSRRSLRSSSVRLPRPR